MSRTKHRQPVDTVVEKGQVIPIYHTPEKKGGRTYDSFTIAYVQNGIRRRGRAPTLDKARERARQIARQLASGTGHHFTPLSAAETADYQEAVRVLRSCPGVTVQQACIHYADAATRLGDRGTIARAVDHYLEATARLNRSITCKDLVEEFLAAKSREDLSARYLADCRSRLSQFLKVFRCNIDSITTQELQRWLDQLPGGQRTRKNHATGIKTLFEFARKRGYLSRSMETEAAHVSVGRVKEAAPQIYSPEQLHSVLDKATGFDQLAVALGAYTGTIATQ